LNSDSEEDALEVHRLAAIVGAMDDAVVELTLDGVVRFWSRGAARMFGYTSAQMRGESFERVCPPGELAEYRELLRTAQIGSVVRPYQSVRLRHDGGTLPVSCTMLPIRDEDGPVVAVVIIMRDETEVQAFQGRLASADRLALVGQLAGGVAHEINNPLTAVISNMVVAEEVIAELRQGLASGRPFTAADLARLSEPLVDAKAAAIRALDTARDLKVFARPDDGRRETVDVRRIIESALRVAGNDLRQRARVVKQMGTMPPVEAHGGHLGQLFLNLLNNAAQAIAPGHSADNEVRVITSTDGAGRALIEISDTGPGIPAELGDRIFEPYVTTKPIGVGTGLGLTMCRRIVTDLGGTLVVGATGPRGTTMVVTLPGKVVEIAAGATPAAATRGRILVIDDEPVVSRAVQRVLQAQHEVVTAASAERGLERLRAGEHYDIIFCDLMMPGMTGMAFYEVLAADMPQLTERVIFLSGGAFTQRARRFLETNTNLQLDKPFDASELRALVNARLAAGLGGR
jgi:PAS domain S-box-containing protein